jgi:hypothetical protein
VPASSSSFLVYIHAREERRVRQRRQDSVPRALREVHFPGGAVGERQPKTVIADDLNARDVDQLLHAVIARKRLDRLERLLAASALPVRLELSAVKAGPLSDQVGCARRECTGEPVAIRLTSSHVGPGDHWGTKQRRIHGNPR